MNKKIKVGVIYGGKSFEHEVSKMTAESILEHIDRSLFDVREIYIDQKGNFDESLISDIDIAFLAVHGPNCEDGKLQQYLEKKGIKYTGPGEKASQINLSKILARDAFIRAGLPVPKAISFTKKNIEKIASEISGNFNLPLFVKPNNTGSSVGISKVKSHSDLMPAVKDAFKYDETIVIEEGIVSPRELEIGVLGNTQLTISDPGEILSGGEFYSYEKKYLKPFKTTTEVKDLSQMDVAQLKKMAKTTYQTTGCRGYSRVDFFMDKNNKFYINEINTLPGFTKISMFPKLMQQAGITYNDLITKIINLGLENAKS